MAIPNDRDSLLSDQSLYSIVHASASAAIDEQPGWTAPRRILQRGARAEGKKIERAYSGLHRSFYIVTY